MILMIDGKNGWTESGTRIDKKYRIIVQLYLFPFLSLFLFQ
jgi:hypothetical protein